MIFLAPFVSPEIDKRAAIRHLNLNPTLARILSSTTPLCLWLSTPVSHSTADCSKDPSAETKCCTFMSAVTSSATSPRSSHFLSPRGPTPAYTPHTSQQQSSWPALPLPSYAVAAEADAPLNLGLDEEEVVWSGESVGLGFGLLSRLKEKTNALLEAIDWDCRLCGKTATDPCVTRCGHLFCWSDLNKHLDRSPRCPTCSAPLSITRDVVQVFGRPKVVPNDAPWTSVNHTPGSRGSVAEGSTVKSTTSEKSAPAFNRPTSEKENLDLNVPPPPASPIDQRLRASPISLSAPGNNPYPSRGLAPSRKGSFDQALRRRTLHPLTTIRHPGSDSSSVESLVKPPINLFVTNPSSESGSGSDNINAREEKEEDPWSAWKRASDAPTITPRRGSHPLYSISHNDNLRPPSPSLRTRGMRPGWGAQDGPFLHTVDNASTDSFDTHLRQSINVKFTRGISFDDSDAGGRDGDAESDGDAIFLHSPSRKNQSLPGACDMPPLQRPVPQYAFKPEAAVALPDDSSVDYRAAGRQWYAEQRQRSMSSNGRTAPVSPTTSSSIEKKPLPEDDFETLKVAIADEKKTSGIMSDPLGRALCVVGVVVLLKILLK